MSTFYSITIHTHFCVFWASFKAQVKEKLTQRLALSNVSKERVVRM